MAKGKTVTQNNAMQCEAMVHGFKPHLCLEGGKVGMKVAYTSKEEVRSNNSSTRHSVRLRIHAVLQLASMGVQTPLTTVTTLSAQASPPQRGRPGFPQLKDIFPSSLCFRTHSVAQSSLFSGSQLAQNLFTNLFCHVDKSCVPTMLPMSPAMCRHWLVPHHPCISQLWTTVCM